VANVLKIGIIGLGKMGKIRAREIVKFPSIELSVGSDTDTSTFNKFPDIQCTQNYKELLKTDVDIVLVCTVNKYAPDIVMDALNAGKHVFCEKPPGKSVQDVKNIIAAEKRNPGLKLKFGFNHRYHAGIQEAKRIIDSGRLGKILWLRGIYGKSGGLGFEKSWRSVKELCGGGILLDQGIHMLDLFRFFCGDFIEVKSMVTTAYWDIELEDNAFALLRDKYGRIAMLHSSSTQWKHRFNLEIYLSEGYLSVNGILSSTRSYGDETITVARKQFDEGFADGKPREEIIYFDTDPSWELELAEFLSCIRKNKPIISGNSDDALKAMQLVYSIYQSDSNGKEYNG
jgi:predicted dehydrogenase